MSTRANIIVKDDYEKLYFYRHYDGYPEGILPTLEKFMNYIKNGTLRNSVEQSAGWLILFGASEHSKSEYILTEPKDWKVGAIEPATEIQMDIDFLYICDLNKIQIKVCEPKEFLKSEQEKDFEVINTIRLKDLDKIKF